MSKESKPDIKISKLGNVSVSEYQKIAYSWNETDIKYNKNLAINQLFEKQINNTPNNIALIFKDTQITYLKLNDRANQLVHYLIKKFKIQANDLIVICLDRSEYILISILAILKAGGAYIPIYPNYSDDLIKHIIEDTNSKIIITNSVYQEKLENLSDVKRELLLLDQSKLHGDLLEESKDIPITNTKTSDLIYVIIIRYYWFTKRGDD